MRRQSSISFIPVNSGTPDHEKLCGKYLQTFAYVTIKDRLPVILTKVIDHLARDKNQIIAEYGNNADQSLKVAIGKLSKLKNEVETNKPLVPIESTADDVSEWNSYLDQEGPASWYLSPWLYTENYLYRRVQEIFETSDLLNGFDPFRQQKEQAFNVALSQLQPLVQSLNSESDCLAERFVTAIKISLWSNKCDLSLSNGVVEANDDPLVASIKALDEFILKNDVEEALQVIQQSSSKIVDIVHDNASFELFCDLCLADTLIRLGLADTVRLRVKKFPWYVSDTTKADLEWLLNRLPSEGLTEISEKWKGYLAGGQWLIVEDKFWTLPFPYSEMQERDPKLYSSLAEASLIIFKGDLNYRKLLGDINWNFSEPFKQALQGFQPSNILALRTIKADIVCGLALGKTEALFQKEPLWMRTGEYAVVQLSKA